MTGIAGSSAPPQELRSNNLVVDGLRSLQIELDRAEHRTVLKPDVPKAMRDAATLVHEHGTALGIQEHGDLLARLNTAPGARVTRTILNTDDGPDTRIQLIRTTIDDAGIQQATPPPDLPAIQPDDIRHNRGTLAVREGSHTTKSLQGKGFVGTPGGTRTPTF